MSPFREELMISASDLKNAVTAGVLDQATADKLAGFVMKSPAGEAADDENLRLITGFNDIFVGIGLILFFGALFFVVDAWAYAIAPVAAWALAEIFTRRMRMALPSIMLLVIFGFSLFGGILHLFPASQTNMLFRPWWTNYNAAAYAAGAAATVVGAALHWWRFHVPITVAAGVGALVAGLMAGLTAAFGEAFTTLALYALLVLGGATFALAMFFDMQDRLRRTQLSDRAFWLHMLAAPMIIHPLMAILGKTGADGAVSAFVLVALVALVALVIDRRALLVSSLGYLIVTFASLAKVISTSTDWNATQEAGGWSVLLVGLLVLLLSVAWRPLRAAFVPLLPEAMQSKFPVVSTK